MHFEEPEEVSESDQPSIISPRLAPITTATPRYINRSDGSDEETTATPRYINRSDDEEGETSRYIGAETPRGPSRTGGEGGALATVRTAKSVELENLDPIDISNA